MLVVPAILSRIGILERYLEQVRDTGKGRYTLPEAHDAAYNAISDTVSKIARSGLADRMHLFKRGVTRAGTFIPDAGVADDIAQAYLSLRDAPLSTFLHEQARLQLGYIRSLAEEFGRTELFSQVTALEKDLDQMTRRNL